MTIENRMVVSLNYRLTVDENGMETEVEQTTAENPFVFLFGSDSVLPAFEANLLGKTIGDRFDFQLTPQEGYGISDDRNILNIAIAAFFDAEGKPDPNLLIPGNMLTMSDQDGRMFRGIVKEIGTESVVMDFNHPLAGKQLHFTGAVVNVRLATSEELQHGHVHGPGGHHH
jgi:FKBP-type peptidyl-prolyl cis-trans isomerase SlyD